MNRIKSLYHKNITLEQAISGGNFKIRLSKGKTIRVTIKPGSYSGKVIRLKEPGKMENGKKSDTFIELKVLDHPLYSLDGLNLNASIILTPTEALLGCSKRITGPNGKPIVVNVPPESKDGDRIILNGAGLINRQETGDIVLKVNIDPLDELNFSLIENDNTDPGTILN